MTAHSDAASVFGLGSNRRRQQERDGAQHRGGERPHQYAELDVVLKVLVAGEGEQADEQAHGEADAAEQRDAEICSHAGAAPAGRRSPSRITSADAAEDADQLADEQAERDAERQAARPARRRPCPAKETPALAKPKIGTMRKAHQAVQRVLQPVQRRVLGSSAPPGAARSGMVSASSDAGERRVDAGAQHQDPEDARPSTR